MRYVHVELLLGRRVRDARGRVVGRIVTLHAIRDGAKCFVDEYHLGPGALLERLGMRTAHLVGLGRKGRLRRIPWQIMDLSDPERPRLTVTLEDLPQHERKE